MKILNLYAGIGGNRKLWSDDHEITAVEIDPKIALIYQDLFPKDKVIIGDAHEFLLKHFKEFDFIWSSPPCPSHSQYRKNIGVVGKGFKPIYPDMQLYEEIILLQHHFKGKWVVENVVGYYDPLIRPQECGRHYFWANFPISKRKFDYDIGTMNRKASKLSQRKAIIREAQIPELTDLHGFDLSKYSLPNKREVLRNAVLPQLALHVFEMAFKKPQLTLNQVGVL